MYSGSQSILTCNSVKLRDSSVYFVHSPISRANLLFYKQSRPTTQNSPRRSFNACANKAAFQLQATDRLLSRASRHNNNNLSGPGSCSLSARAKCQKITSTHVHNAELNPDDESREDPDDQAAIPPPNANTTGEEPLNEAQPPITVDQITSIVLAIVNSKLATLSSMPGLAKASTAEPAVNFGDPNSVHQLLSTPSSNSGDLAAHADEKTWKAIVKGEYVDFVSLLHENSTASPHRSRSAYPNHQWRILTHFFSEPEES